MGFFGNGSAYRQALGEDRTRPDRPHLPVVTTLLGMLAMLNIASAVLTLMK